MASNVGLTYIAGSSFWQSPGRPNLAPGTPPAVTTPKLRWNGSRAIGPVVVAPTIPGDWSDSNPPWIYSDPAVLMTDVPGGTYIVDIQTGSSDFYTNLSNTVAAAGRRCVVRLHGGQVYHLNQFRLIGSSGDPTYSFGFWFPNLQGFISDSAQQAIIQMDANSMSNAQLTALSQMTQASFAPNQMGLCRIDGSASSPVFLLGIKFRAEDQQMLTAKASDLNVYVPQPAPHQGVVLYYGAYSYIEFCNFKGAGRAINSQPPFEHANLSTARGLHWIKNCEFDGRRDPALDVRTPRRCGPVMGNNESELHFIDCWFHHSNVSRYAINDQNAATSGIYEVTRCKSEQITNTQNTDPAINGGASLGGWTNASNFGWESCNGTINITDAFISVDNGNYSGQFPAHLQLTSVGSRNPQGGRMHVKGGTFKNTAAPQLNGYLTLRIASSTFWYTDGVATTLDIRRSDNTPLTGYNVTGTWPPTASQLASAGVSPSTHYLYKGV